MKWKRKIKKLEKAVAPRMVEVPQYRVLFSDGTVEIMRPLDYAYATSTAGGREGKIIGKAPSMWEPVNPHPDYTALNEAFEGMKVESLEEIQAQIKERIEKEKV